MYNVDQARIDRYLECIPEVSQALSDAAASWTGTLMEGLAQERALHLAIEIVTDVGNLLIDGFIMRDASSYEDIVEIIAMEGVVSEQLAEPLKRLVTMRKALVQEYEYWPRRELHPLAHSLPSLLLQFNDQVKQYLIRELTL
ncbi:MAG: DUF86 domain-containing protein [Candidatus Cohnella colombiensis]|uniref:DUF86 domain-containing protein n=1 Tax=Candidatus Cohnella colombiensis TaxID=3121368 RepID=A0AA95ETY8_9BACL|nr:MAG: DUF86 domain-containing protein [Cohnella sp.]